MFKNKGECLSLTQYDNISTNLQTFGFVRENFRDDDYRQSKKNKTYIYEKFVAL